MLIQRDEQPFMTDVDALQAQLVAARRNQILDAAIKVFAEKGFDRATIRDIAKTAGIADGTIYNYFDNKNELLLGIINRLSQSTFVQAEDMTNVREWLRSALNRHYESLPSEYDKFFRAIFPEVLVNKELAGSYVAQVLEPAYALIEKCFQAWIDNGLVRPLDSALTVRAVSGMIIGLHLLRLIGEPHIQEHWDRLPDVITQIIVNGLKK
jgi:TetR/AcrR family fatty acid metabolism transcriptional regulator